MDFLSGVIGGGGDPRTLSSFTESIVLATICGRSLSHRQQCTVERVYGNISQDFWSRHQWLDSILSQKIQVLSLTEAYPCEVLDPIPLFTNMTAQATVLSLRKAIRSVQWNSDDYRTIINDYEARALLAAQQIVALSEALAHLSYFKASVSKSASSSSPLTYCNAGTPFYSHSSLLLCRVLQHPSPH
jgi:hypothetical protein